MEFSCDKDGTLCLKKSSYLDKLLLNYKQHFGTGPKTNVGAPLKKGDHPKMDTTDFLDAEKIKLYQSLIRAQQWMVTIGCFDIMTAVVTLLAFCAAPCIGHLEQAKRIFGYLAKMNIAKLHIRTEQRITWDCLILNLIGHVLYTEPWKNFFLITDRNFLASQSPLRILWMLT